MKNEIWLGKKNLRFFYYRYKDTKYYSLTIILVSILVSIILFFNVIIPQVQSWFSIREEIRATQERLRIINSNILLMRNLDKELLDQQSNSALAAVPIEKDFGAILQTISDSALNSNVALDDFGFSLKQDNKAVKTERGGSSFTTITLIARGDMQTVRHFINELEERLPLSEVGSINGTGNSALISIQFYSKEFAEIPIKDDAPINLVSENNRQLLQKLLEWENKSIEDEQAVSSDPSASSAASLF